MALIWLSSPSNFLHKDPNPIHFPSPILPFSLRSVAVRATGTEGGDPSLLIRPLVSSPLPIVSSDGGDEAEERSKAEDLLDWEDQILEETLPLVEFVSTILHSGNYNSGDRLIPEHERTILERLLPYHPAFEKKIACGIDYITIGYHPKFENSRCLFIVRKDGQLEDFSYWKCIKGLIKKNYSLYADSFILRHFRRSRQTK